MDPDTCDDSAALLVSENSVELVFQIKDWQVRTRAIGYWAWIEALDAVALTDARVPLRA